MADPGQRSDTSRRGFLKGVAGTAAAAAAGVSLTQPAAAAGERVALQYFHEDWQTITNDLDRVGSLDFDAIWIQQPAESDLDWSDQGPPPDGVGYEGGGIRNNPPLGYQPIDFTNFDSSFGTESDLTTLIDTAHDNGVDVIVDTVMNHTANTTDYSILEQFGRDNFHNVNEGIPGWSYSFNPDDSRCFENGSPKDPDRIECDPDLVEDAALLGLNDLDQDQQYVRDVLKNYMEKIASLGADGYRFDAAKHMAESFFADYANQWAEANGMFRVGEVYSGNREYLRGYANAGPGMHVFDFNLYYTMTNDEGGVFDGGDMSQLEGAGLIATDPGKAMPFVENHDVAAPSQYELAHAFVLSSPGYPMLYNLYPDEILGNDNIANAVWVKKNLAGGPVRWRYTDNDVAIYEREGNLLAGLNNGGSDRTETVKTSWTDQELNDYAGNQPNVTTAGDGTVQITVPAGGWVFYAVPGQGDSPGTGDLPVYSVSNLDHPASATAGDTITVSANLTNTGDADGAETVELLVDGSVEQSSEVSLTVDESTTVSFDYDTATGDTGSLAVEISTPDDSQSGTVDVSAPQITLRVEAPTADGESVYFTGKPVSLTDWGGGIEGTYTDGGWEVTIDDPGSFEWKTRRGPAGAGGDVWENDVSDSQQNHTDADLSPTHQGWEDGFTGSGDSPPTASFSVSPSSPDPGEQVTFDASESSDPDGDIQSYEWDLTGDGTTDATGQQVTYTFDSEKSYDVTLTVADGSSETADDTASATVDVATDASVVDRYDANGDGCIDISELNTGIGDYFDDDASIDELNALITQYFECL